MSLATDSVRAACSAQMTFDSPLGPLLLARTPAGLAGAWFEGQKDHPGALAAALRPDDPLLASVVRQLQHYFAGELQVFNIPLDLLGTPFQRAVWHALLRIEAGTTCSYRDIARDVGRPSAVRAVGAAIGRNPVSIIVPCHRVIGSDGSPTGYAGGIDRKIALLRLEHAEGRLYQAPHDERTRAGVNGNSRIRTPVASANALAIAAAAGPCATSPMPKKGAPGRSTIFTSMRSGTSGKRSIG